MGTVLLVAFLLAAQVGLAVWEPNPVTIAGVVFITVMLLLNVLMWRDRR